MHRSLDAALAALCLALFLSGCGEGTGAASLRFYVGGTMRPAVEEIVPLWEAETGRKVDLDFGDSGACAIKAENTGQGDLVIVHDPFHGVLEGKRLVLDGVAVATLEPVIGVAKGNPKAIGGLKDLARPGVRVILTDLKYSTAGPIAAVMARKAGIEEALEKNVVSRTRAGGEAANAVVLGNADATIVWNAVVRLRAKDLDAVPIEAAYRPDPKSDPVIAEGIGPIDPSRVRVTVDVLRSSARADEARSLARFLASDRAAEVWRRLGFGPPPEEKTLLPAAAEAPASREPILVLCAAGLRQPMEEIAGAFSKATGVTVERDYAGSGAILSRLRLSKTGDVFLPADEYYLDLAEKDGLIASKAAACWFVPVILVQKGNPKAIAGLEDLARPGLRIGLGNPETCQVGRACEALIAKNRLDAGAVRRNLVFSSVTVNELGIQIVTGHLDAAVVWDAVATQYPGADAVAIPLEKNDVSRASIGVLTCARNRGGAGEFVRFVLGDEGRAILRKHGYRTEPPR